MDTELEKAKICAFRLLKFRIRSKSEMETRLKQKKFSLIIIREVLDFLTDLGYLNDLTFARSWISNRQQLKPRSKRLITFELRQKGIDPKVIEQAFSSTAHNSDAEIVQELAMRKYAKLKAFSPEIAQRRLIGYLERKGFNSAQVINIVKGLINNDQQSS